jgi:hypothetical protein
LGAVACCFIVWLTLPRSGITRANYERIQEGMVEQEVEGILGGRAGNYSRFPDKEAGLWAMDPDDPQFDRQYFRGREVWVGDDLAVAVWFDDHQRVVRKAAFAVPKQSVWDKLRRWLPW